ncbi:MAG: hypothetical protein AAF583_03315, partial [Pseudomonadota bacterium]
SRARRGLDGDRQDRDDPPTQPLARSARGGRRERTFLDPSGSSREEWAKPKGRKSEPGVAAEAVEASADPGQISPLRGRDGRG